jgi:alkanesulfonate monooxygenase SsuD/methylene tetrahydromethanopterin reductase-like flavin-dependent oxidoreductase (luciferase family)
MKVEFGISTSPQATSYAALRDVWQAADETDVFTSGWVNDHFAAFIGPPWKPDLDQGSADGWTVLAALLHETNRLRGGVLVTGVHFRSAAKLAHMVATLDWSTGGRVDLGLGAGWSPEECDTFGVQLGEVGERLDRFEEHVEATVRLLSGETVTTSGTHVQLNEARLTVRGPSDPHPPICIGGMGERRTLPLAARYAQHWSYEGADLGEFAHKLEVLHRCCDDIGRDPGEIRASAKVRFAVGDPPALVAERAASLIDAGATLPLISFPRPLDASLVGPIAAALAPLIGL